MKTKFTLLIAVLFLSFNFVAAQPNEQDLNSLSIFSEYAKAKNYDAAYAPWMELRQRNPKFNRAIYTYGERILKDKIEKSSGAEKVGFINDLLKLWDERMQYFAAKTKTGDVLSDKAQLMYDHKSELGVTDKAIFDAFDKAYKTDEKTFTNPKALYTYFSVLVDLHNSGVVPVQDVFNKYDELTDKIDREVNNYSKKVSDLLAKEEAGTALTRKEGQVKKSAESFLVAYDKISGSIDSKLGILANCENLIPLYNRDFEQMKTDPIWLQRAAGRMSAKDCTSDPLFFKLVNAYHNISPSANSAYYLGLLKDKEGNSTEAINYYNQAIDLESDSFEKAKILKKIASKLRKSGSYGNARNYYMRALDANPSDVRPYLSIAQMYASSANNCGTDNFSKRAVFWLAAQMARKGGSSSTAANYMAKAPQKSEIFAKGNAGEKINIGCWIGRSVTVPNL
jgi:tetratricopeptide (TPR) repeat protein